MQGGHWSTRSAALCLPSRDQERNPSRISTISWLAVPTVAGYAGRCCARKSKPGKPTLAGSRRTGNAKQLYPNHKADAGSTWPTSVCGFPPCASRKEQRRVFVTGVPMNHRALLPGGIFRRTKTNRPCRRRSSRLLPAPVLPHWQGQPRSTGRRWIQSQLRSPRAKRGQLT